MGPYLQQPFLPIGAEPAEIGRPHTVFGKSSLKIPGGKGATAPDSLEKNKPRQQEQQQHANSAEEPSYSARQRATLEISLNPAEICLEAKTLLFTAQSLPSAPRSDRGVFACTSGRGGGLGGLIMCRKETP